MTWTIDYPICQSSGRTKKTKCYYLLLLFNVSKYFLTLQFPKLHVKCMCFFSVVVNHCTLPILCKAFMSSGTKVNLDKMAEITMKAICHYLTTKNLQHLQRIEIIVFKEDMVDLYIQKLIAETHAGSKGRTVFYKQCIP